MNSASNNPFAPSDRVLRQFSGIWIVFFGALAAVQMFHYHRQSLASILALLAVTLGPVGIIWPRAMKPIFVGWMVLVFPIGWVVSRAILATLYYGMFTPVALIFRVIGRDALLLKQRHHTATYWLPKASAKDKSQYLRQF